MVTDSDERRFINHMKIWAQNLPILCEIPRPLMITLISQLQLALRHPQNPPHAKALTIDFINQSISAIESEDPFMAEILRKGNFYPR
jgi:hypothetical protein